MESLIQAPAGRMDRYRHWSPGSRAADTRMPTTAGSCLADNSQGSCAVIGCLQNGEACMQKLQGRKTKSHLFLQFPKDFGPSQVHRAAHQEGNLRKEEGSVPRNQRWSRSHLKCPSSKSGKLSASQHHHLSVISVMAIKKQNITQQAEREETEDIVRAKSTLGENITLPQPQTPEARPSVLTSKQ